MINDEQKQVLADLLDQESVSDILQMMLDRETNEWNRLSKSSKVVFSHNRKGAGFTASQRVLQHEVALAASRAYCKRECLVAVRKAAIAYEVATGPNDDGRWLRPMPVPQRQLFSEASL